MTLEQQIVNSQTYKLGLLVCPGRLANAFKVSREEMRTTCKQLVQQGFLEVCEHGYRKPERLQPVGHWIHTSRLTDHEGLTAARVGA